MKVPPAMDCVVNPIPCYHSVTTTIATVIEVENHHGLGTRRIAPSAIPSQYTQLIPSSLRIVAADTNAGLPSVARRGYVLSIQFATTAPDSLRDPFVHLLGRHWGVFVDTDILTLYHPFTPRLGIHYGDNQTGYAILRDLDRTTTAH